MKNNSVKYLIPIEMVHNIANQRHNLHLCQPKQFGSHLCVHLNNNDPQCNRK